jgi:signal transduction histidine kinase
VENKAKILLVDDEISYGQMTSRILSSYGYNSVAVLSADAALKTLEKESFDLLMTDIIMPNMDGLELIEVVSAAYPDLPILVTTGMAEIEVAIKALEMGAYGYLLKPCNDFEIAVQVANALRRAELEKLASAYQTTLEAEVNKRTAELEEANRQLENNIISLQQNDKLASIGLLAAGIAHEIKTPTGYLGTNLAQLKIYLPRLSNYIRLQKDLIESLATGEQQTPLRVFKQENKIDFILDDLPDLVENCLDGTSRIRKIITGLREYSFSSTEVHGPLDLNEIIENSLTLAGSELKQMAEVSLEKGALPKIQGNAQRLSQIFINLILNSVYATHSLGVIKISTTPEAHGVLVRVTDNGLGMDKETVEHIFEPFFTTKDIHSGTGLGLSVVKTIVEEHHGAIEIESTLGAGTTFRIHFPAADEEG